MDSHWFFWEEVLDTHREQALHFLTDLGFPPEPRGEAAVAFTPFPALGCALSHSCHGAGARRGPVPLLPRDPSTGQTHGPIPAGIFLCGGVVEKMGKMLSAAFPTSQQPQEQQAAEDAWTPRGCLAQSSFAPNCTQATRFLPYRGAFGMQPLHPVQLQGCPAEPMDGSWRWESEGRAAPDSQALAQHLCNVSLPAPANLPCFAEPQGGINIAKPPVAPTALGASREALLNSTAAPGSLTLCTDSGTGTGNTTGTSTSTSTGSIQGCAAVTHGAELGLRCEMQSRLPEL